MPSNQQGQFGPQYAGDNALTARMRFHQSWYRAERLHLGWGTGPMPHSTRELGSMMTRKDGAAGKNFVNLEVFRLAQRRIAEKTGTVDEFRLLHNMLSSQPMCFNLFGYLSLDLELASRAFALLDSDVARATDVRMEWNPEPATDYLDDRTAFDVFVEYERVGGGKGFFGIETKLTEPFSQKEYDGPVYRRWLEVPGAPWRKDAADELPVKAYNQLWRNHLLAFALLQQSGKYDVGAVAVVGHPADEELARTIDGQDATYVAHSRTPSGPLIRPYSAISFSLPSNRTL